MLTLAVENGDLHARPVVPTLRIQNTRTGFLDGAELEAVIANLPDPLQPVARLTSLTGWRRGEIVSLTWAQVDFEYGTITLEVGTTKNDEGRIFPFGALPALVELFEAQLAYTRAVERETGRIIPYVFHRFGGRPIGEFYDAWNTACETAGVPGMLFHDLRRTGARNLVRAGVPEKTAMKLIGHKTRSMFDRYNIVDSTDLRDGVARLAEYLQTREPAPRTVVPLHEKAALRHNRGTVGEDRRGEGVAAERKSG